MTMVAQKGESHLPYPYGDVSSDEKIRSEILNGLHHNSGVPQEAVRVAVVQGHVVLSGDVAQDFERDLAERIARTAPGVADVTNEIKLPS